MEKNSGQGCQSLRMPVSTLFQTYGICHWVADYGDRHGALPVMVRRRIWFTYSNLFVTVHWQCHTVTRPAWGWRRLRLRRRRPSWQTVSDRKLGLQVGLGVTERLRCSVPTLHSSRWLSELVNWVYTASESGQTPSRYTTDIPVMHRHLRRYTMAVYK